MTTTATRPFLALTMRRAQLADRLRAVAPGVALALVLALAAMALGHAAWLQASGIGALTLAIVLGIVAGNTVLPRIAATAAPGVGFSKQALLRLGIVLYGLRLTFQDIGQVGLRGVAIDALVLASTFALASIAGTRLFGLDRTTAMLIGAGSSICGAAAVMATAPVVRGKPEQVSVAVSTVVVFGTLAIFVYPVLYQLNARCGWLAFSDVAYGVFAGSTIHEVAQVVAAGHAISAQAADTAVIAKMVRVMMLAPFLVSLSAWLARAARREALARAAPAAGCRGGIVVPWFAFGFVAVVGLHSLDWLPRAAIAFATSLDTVVLATAMAALGLATQVSAIRGAGLKPLGLAALLFGWLVGGGLAINLALARLMG